MIKGYENGMFNKMYENTVYLLQGTNAFQDERVKLQYLPKICLPMWKQIKTTAYFKLKRCKQQLSTW